MQQVKRVRGDTYPIEATLKVNSIPIVLGINDEISFNYTTNTVGAIKTIIGVIDALTVGKVVFTPTVGDFSEAGGFKCDIQRKVGTVISTHLLSPLLIEADVS